MRVGVLGNLTIDEIQADGMARIVPGGTALFVSATVSQLGGRVGLFSNVGVDYPEKYLSWLRKRGVDVSAVKVERSFTTRYRISHSFESRELFLLGRGRPLDTTGLPGGWDAIHVGPVYDEVDTSDVLLARSRCTFLSVDIQGFLRRRDDGSTIRTARKRLDKILAVCDLLKASEEEAMIQTSRADPVQAAAQLLSHGPKIVAVTRGLKGVLLASAAWGFYNIPAYPTTIVADATGAGDCFVGAWLVSYLESHNPVWAACVGASFSSLTLNGFGVAKFPVSSKELFRRSLWVYERAKACEI